VRRRTGNPETKKKGNEVMANVTAVAGLGFGDEGWRSPMFFASWAEFELPLDDLNEIVHFYFSVERDSGRCNACDETGYAPKAKTIADAFYDFEGRGTRWCHSITLDEAQALVDGDRLCTKWNGKTWDKPVVDQAFVDKVNGANADGSPSIGGYNHDAINRHMLIKQRCKRLGYPVTCPECDGHGYVYVARDAHVSLTLWLLHPRKGASRGVEVGRIGERDLPAVFEYLASAAKRNAERFASVTRAVKPARRKRGAA